MSSSSILFTADIEDWYHAESLQGFLDRAEAAGRDPRIEQNTGRLLQLLHRHGGKATFFILGAAAEGKGPLIRSISDAGHEIACHGYDHRLIFRQTHGEFAADVTRARKLLEDMTGKKVRGFRAPKFSLTDWAAEVLRECGFEYDSSIVLHGSHDRYGRIESLPEPIGRGIMKFSNGLLEVPLSLLKAGSYLPWSGGGWFRITPYSLFRLGVRHLLRRNGLYTFYIHPWEIDPSPPQVPGLNFTSRLRHYSGRGTTSGKLSRLMKDFSLQSIGDYLSAEAPPSLRS